MKDKAVKCQVEVESLWPLTTVGRVRKSTGRVIARDFMITCHVSLGLRKRLCVIWLRIGPFTSVHRLMRAFKQKVELVDNVASSHVRVTSVDTVSKSFSRPVLLDDLSLSNLTLVASSI